MKKLKQWLIKKFLSVLESEEAKELIIKSSSLLPENIQKNREKISDFMVKYYRGTIIDKKNLEPALKTFFILHPSFRTCLPSPHQQPNKRQLNHSE
jgi:hypothetical protein